MHSLTLVSSLASLICVVGVRAQNGSGSHGPPADANPLAFGFYATPEIQQPVRLEVTGVIPTWIKGSLYRGAAGTWDVGNLTAEHWFDGFSRNHRFEIANGQVEYRSRNASDEVADFVRETGLYPGGSYGSDPCKIVFGAFEAVFRDGTHPHGNTSSNNVPVAWIPNYPGLARNVTTFGSPFETLVTTTDANVLQQIDPVTLEPVEVFTYQSANEDLVTGGASAAHSAFDPDGSIYNFVLDKSKSPPEYRVFKIGQPNGDGRILANITDAPPAYIHSLFSTENHLILIVWQADYGKKATTITGSLKPWDPARKTLFYVIDKGNGGVVSKYVSDDAFFAFHECNAFEDKSGALVIDLPVFETYHFLTAALVTNLRANVGPNSNGSAMNDIPANFTRYLLPNHGAAAKAANGSLITHKAIKVFELDYKLHNIELPRINEKYAGQAYQYVYGVHTVKPGYFVDSLIKIDTHTQTSRVWNPTTNHLPSEPVFIANPQGTAEDDGVLLTVAMDAERKKSSMIVINATTMAEIGRAQMPIAMGYGFHGIFGSGH
ncbi:hypothetical protein MMC06_001860 [Schaereria dolodes]|nr:hypothetical protein [Schaereria dolodes]